MPRLLLLCLFCVPLLAAAAPDNAYLQQLIARAHALNLAADPQWHALVHYLPDELDGGYHSLAVTRNFFNAPDGRYNPQAELDATLRAFFSARQETETQQNPQCAFIARYHWLDSRLHFDPQRLPVRQCRRFEQWYHAIDPAQATLIFPAAYMNNPSSMFGHTLLRIDRPGQDEHSRLISYSINFAAQTKETNGVVFAYKGLTGGYIGTFSILPYYAKVQEYTNMDNRDIWEYQLNLTPLEIRRLLEHAWELGPVGFDYYFFTQNCSYQLLTLLDVARPGMNLAAQFPDWAIPSDTIKAVLAQKGMLKKVVYRPSAYTKLAHRLAAMDPEAQRLTYGIAKRDLTLTDAELTRLPVAEEADILEAAYDYRQYMYVSRKWSDKDNSLYAYQLLSARSKLAYTSPADPVPMPAVRPDQGHDTARVAITTGREWGRDYLQLALRPAYHDLLDPAGGYTKGAQIDFFDIAVRRNLTNQPGTRLQHFTLVNILSLAPRDRFFSPLSWRIAVGWKRLSPLLDPGERLAAYVDGGFGPTYALSQRTLLTAMAEGQALGCDRLPAGDTLAAGGALSLLYTGSEVNVRLLARRRHYYTAHDSEWSDYRAALEFKLGAQTSLRLDAGVEGRPDHLFWNTALTFNRYF